MPQMNLLPFADEVIQPLNTAINILTLASLKIADKIARTYG
jgi:hypothetical protein